MTPELIKLTILIIAATLVSGLGDAQGFIYAPRIWEGDRIHWSAMARSAAGFMGGMVGYWFAAKYMKLAGILVPEMQTMIWFVATILGVAFASGQLVRWPLADQLVAGGVLCGIGWLLWRTGG